MKTDIKNFAALCATLSRKVEAISLMKLAEHGYYGLMPLGEESAPGTLEALQVAYQDRPYGKLFPVFNGASETSIYHDANVNMLMRAWHDLVHIELAAPFTPEGEVEVCRVQQSHPSLTSVDRELIGYDVNSQIQHFVDLGFFPENQRKFVFECMNESATA